MLHGDMHTKLGRVEWVTLAVLIACYAVWALAIFVLAPLNLALAIVVCGVAIAQHSSLQHEIIHGHPTPHQGLNEALIFPALILFIPYQRFRDTHLAHHKDANLTDPYDDPESNYLDAGSWDRLCIFRRALFRLNNTLLGRMIVGPFIAQYLFVVSDIRAIRAGDRAVLRAWMWHVPAVAVVLAVVVVAPMPVLGYVLAAYLGVAVLKIRTFLEHQAHEKSRGRTVVIEDRGPLALLFLNNNYHVVHHMHPTLPWYQLPALFRARKQRYLSCNDGYYYASYWQVISKHLWRAKDPVVHPLWRREG